MVQKRRRLSSDGFKLFNMAYSHPPSYSRIKEMLHCIWHTEYDDKLETMVEQCRDASEQIYSIHNNKDVNINYLLNNAIYNLIYCILCEDDKLTTKHQVKRNYRYFMDVMQMCYNEEDHNTAILILNALQHTALKIFKIKLRKKDKMFMEEIEKKYGTWRDSWLKHLVEVMTKPLDALYIPSLMVLNIHKEKNRIYGSHVNLKNAFSSEDIAAYIGMYTLYHNGLAEKITYPLYEEPPVKDNPSLMMLANSIK
ncbi:MAG: hypothetical protein CMF41_03485 [Legionellales bacterium]|nr:hypothetical protein [Legionellales bacterium]